MILNEVSVFYLQINYVMISIKNNFPIFLSFATAYGVVYYFFTFLGLYKHGKNVIK